MSYPCIPAYFSLWCDNKIFRSADDWVINKSVSFTNISFKYLTGLLIGIIQNKTVCLNNNQIFLMENKVQLYLRYIYLSKNKGCVIILLKLSEESISTTYVNSRFYPQIERER